MNGKVSKQIKALANDLPPVYINKKVDSVVLGKELLKTMKVFEGEKIMPKKHYKVTKKVVVQVNHFDRMKALYNGGGFPSLEKYCNHSQAVGKRQKFDIENKLMIVPRQTILQKIGGKLKKLFKNTGSKS